MTWRPRDEWDRMAATGERCPLCARRDAGVTDSDTGVQVAVLQAGTLWLSKNQYSAGYCILVANRHVREPYELTADEHRVYFDELLRVGAAIDRVFNPLKMNFMMLGTAVPHLHCHVMPRYYGDAEPGGVLDMNKYVAALPSPEAYHERATAIRAALLA